MRIFALFVCLLVTLSGTQVHSQDKHSGITVVELFTTQGCPSCPPADRIFENVAYSATNDPNLIALSCHVTYFDRRGWRDKLSKPLPP